MNLSVHRWLVFGLCIMVVGISAAKDESGIIRDRIHYEKDLRLKLQENYDRKVRPSGNVSDTVSVYVSLMLLHIEGIDEERQVFKVHAWTGMRWNDVRLKWDSPEYGNITVLHTSDEELWLPDVALYNNAEGKDIQNFGATTATVQSNGDVLWIPPASFSAQCRMTFHDWPRDKHRCHLIIGSWTQHGWDLDLQLGDKAAGIDTANFVENDQWILTNVSASRSLVYYPCCLEPYVSLSFALQVRRNPSHYNYTLLYPAIILLIASWMLFIVPDFRFRLIIGLLEILAFCGESVCLWIIVPPTLRYTPPIVSLAALAIGCVFYAIIWCIILDVISRSKRQPPQWIRTTFNPKMGAALCTSASRFFSPMNFGLQRDMGIDGDKETLAGDYDKEDQGYHEAMNDGPAVDSELPPSKNAWKTFAAIISRIVLLHYAILTIVVIAMNA